MSTQIDLGPVLSVPKGDWNADTTYERLNMVRHNSAAWICNVATSKGVEPTEDSTDWYLQVKDTSSVTSVNGMKGDVVITLTETETPPANDDSNRIATTEWVTDKLGDVDLSGIKEDTVLAAQNAGSLEVGTGELTSAELAVIIENNDTALRALIAEEMAKYLPIDGSGNMYGDINRRVDIGAQDWGQKWVTLAAILNNNSERLLNIEFEQYDGTNGAFLTARTRDNAGYARIGVQSLADGTVRGLIGDLPIHYGGAEFTSGENYNQVRIHLFDRWYIEAGVNWSNVKNVTFYTYDEYRIWYDVASWPTGDAADNYAPGISSNGSNYITVSRMSRDAFGGPFYFIRIGELV